MKYLYSTVWGIHLLKSCMFKDYFLSLIQIGGHKNWNRIYQVPNWWTYCISLCSLVWKKKKKSPTLRCWISEYLEKLLVLIPFLIFEYFVQSPTALCPIPHPDLCVPLQNVTGWCPPRLHRLLFQAKDLKSLSFQEHLEWPLMLHNHSSVFLPNEKELLLIGGGGNCFSFGTHLNPKPVSLSLRNILTSH